MVRAQCLQGVADRQPLDEVLNRVAACRLVLGFGLKRSRGWAAPQVDGEATGDREQEAANRAPGRVEAARLLPQAHEGLLHQLLGQALVAEQPQSQPVQPGLIPAIQLLQGPTPVAGGHPGQQGRLVLDQRRGRSALGGSQHEAGDPSRRASR
jgi:hypothetical protein